MAQASPPAGRLRYVCGAFVQFQRVSDKAMAPRTNAPMKNQWESMLHWTRPLKICEAWNWNFDNPTQAIAIAAHDEISAAHNRRGPGLILQSSASTEAPQLKSQTAATTAIKVFSGDDIALIWIAGEAWRRKKARCFVI